MPFELCQRICHVHTATEYLGQWETTINKTLSIIFSILFRCTIYALPVFQVLKATT